jgi:hypothetical protein
MKKRPKKKKIQTSKKQRAGSLNRRKKERERQAPVKSD